MSRRRRSNRRVGSLWAHVASLCCISLIIKGLHLIWSGSLHFKQIELPPSPCGRISRSRTTTGAPPAWWTSGSTPWHSIMPSLVHMLDFHALGRLPVAVLVLASCKSMPMPWSGCVLSMTPCGRATCTTALGCRRHTSPAPSSAFRLLSRVGEGDISALGCELTGSCSSTFQRSASGTISA
jgi:hypothetical protein